MRASKAAATAAAIPATLALLIAVSGGTAAQSDCQAAFAKWAQLSSAQVRPIQDGSARGACIPSEAARRSLLEALARTRGACGDASDDTQQPTRTLISINQTFISSLSVCRTVTAEKADPVEKDDDGGGDGWSIKTAPTPQKAPLPKIAAPLPAPTPPPVSAPMTGGPRPSVISPKPVVVAPPVTPPKAEDGGGAVGAPKPPCLEVAAVSGDLYSFINRRCRGHTVLAVIETRTASGETICKGYSVGVGVNLKGMSPPRINYECVANAGGCNKDRLGDMFPECDW